MASRPLAQIFNSAVKVGKQPWTICELVSVALFYKTLCIKCSQIWPTDPWFNLLITWWRLKPREVRRLIQAQRSQPASELGLETHAVGIRCWIPGSLVWRLFSNSMVLVHLNSFIFQRNLLWKLICKIECRKHAWSVEVMAAISWELYVDPGDSETTHSLRHVSWAGSGHPWS